MGGVLTDLVASIDDEILKDFEENFPEINVAHLDEKDFKTPAAKEKWRNFMNKYEKRVNEYNFGSLIRIDCKEDYTEQNTMFGVRMQVISDLHCVDQKEYSFVGSFMLLRLPETRRD